ncbi:MAG: RsmD family RNA methyltransferase [Acidobacteriota bacterium]
MRITGGIWRSRRLKGPSRQMPLRPTPDSMRERAFQVLGPEVVDAAFLDLFAGTGAVGLEALSRGAAKAVFVEEHPAAVRLIRRNIEQFVEAHGRTKVQGLSASAGIRRLARSGETFDIAWADPPFPTWQDGAEALEAAFAEGVIRPEGVACLECPERADIGELPDGLDVKRELGGGASRLLILSWSKAR